MKNWIDVTVPIVSGMVHWPGDPEVSVTKLASMSEGAVYNATGIAMSVHTGTHMDAPLHFVNGAAAIDTMPLEAVIGTARVIPIGDPQAIRRAELEAFNLQKGERLIFKTTNSRRAWHDLPFDENFVYIAKDAAELIAERGVQTVAVDYLSVGGFRNDLVETHQVLLSAGVWIIEGLDLRQVEPGDYELIALPLKVVGADGAPARAVLRRI